MSGWQLFGLAWVSLLVLGNTTNFQRFEIVRIMRVLSVEKSYFDNNQHTFLVFLKQIWIVCALAAKKAWHQRRHRHNSALLTISPKKPRSAASADNTSRWQVTHGKKREIVTQTEIVRSGEVCPLGPASPPAHWPMNPLAGRIRTLTPQEFWFWVKHSGWGQNS